MISHMVKALFNMRMEIAILVNLKMDKKKDLAH
jgi:hypothetical protein